MKRITFFLSLLLMIFAGVGSAWAQSFRVSDAPTNGQWGEHTYWYYIQNQDGNAWISTSYVDSDGYLMLNNTTQTLSEEGMWCLVGSETDGYKFYNKAAGTGKVLGFINKTGTSGDNTTYGASRASMVAYDGTQTSSTADNEVGFLFTRHTSSYNSSYDAFSLTGYSENNYKRYMNKRGSYLSYWQHNNVNQGTHKGSSFKFAAINVFEESLYHAEKLKETIDKTQLDNPFYWTSSSYNNLVNAIDQYSSYNETTIGDNKEAAIQALTNAMNLNVAELQDGDKVLLKNYAYTDRYIGCDGTKLTQNRTKASYPNIFTFKKQSDGKWKIYNEYYDMYVGTVPTTANTGIQMISGEDNATAFSVESAILGTANIADKTVNNTFWGQAGCNALHMGDESYGIVIWVPSATAKPSQFYFEKNDIKQTLKDIDEAIIKQANAENYIGYKVPNADVINATSTLKEATEDSHLSAYKALKATIAANTNSIAKPEIGKYYTIESAAYNGKYLAENYSTQVENCNKIISTSYNSNIVPALWQFEQATEDGKTDLYYIKNPNSAQYMSKITWKFKPMRMVEKSDSNVGLFDIFNTEHVSMPLSVTLVYYTDDKKSDRGTACINRNSSDGEDEIESWNATDTKNNNFRIKAVTSIPVSISAAGYATLNLPMAVSIPTGVKAYTGLKEGNVLKLTEISNGIIPAKTPVVLEGEEGKYNFEIAYGDATEKPENGLSGTLVPAIIADDASAYVLGNGSKGVAFYKVTSTTDRTIGANKAYAGSLNEAAAANVLLFSFGGTTTGINQVTTNNSKGSNIFFDINGRRVLYPAHGIFVNGNGEKVFIK